MSTPDKPTLLWSIVKYYMVWRDLMHLRRSGGSRDDQRAAGAQLRQLRSHFDDDGAHHLARIIRSAARRDHEDTV